MQLKESNETGYWLELLFKTGYIDEVAYKSLDSKCTSIRVMLISSINTAKQNAQKSEQLKPLRKWRFYFFYFSKFLLINNKKCGIIIMRNKLNTLCRVDVYFSFEIIYLFLCTLTFEFDKNANSRCQCAYTSYCIKFVSRQSGFAFFMRRLRLAHFLI